MYESNLKIDQIRSIRIAYLFVYINFYFTIPITIYLINPKQQSVPDCESF